MSLLILATVLPSPAEPASERDDDAFESRIRPVLMQTCFPCHGGKKTSGGLRVDSLAAMEKGGENGPSLVKGNPEASLLLRVLRGEDENVPPMPPTGPVEPDVVADFERWVEEGAIWPESTQAAPTETPHWAFQPVRKPVPPDDPTGWSETPVDRFLSAVWRNRGLSPVADADRRTLIRRLTFDLTGLPPTPEELDAFETDDRPDAWSRLVDRLLSSPAYGERWGRHWMDVVRYADTAGDNADYPIPEARLYRDYIVESFNEDEPYDRFVREQLAGDLMAAGDDPRPIIATGFLALTRRYATAPYELWHLSLEDTIETTGRAFLGLTMRCARCHDHKFDPLTTREYYGLYGIFASTTFPFAGSEEFASQDRPRASFVPLWPADEASKAMAERERRLSELDQRIKALEANGPDARKELDAVRAERKTLRRTGSPVGMPVAYGVGDGKPVDVPVQKAGEPSRPGDVVPRGAPSFLGALAPPPVVPPGSSGRRELADWLVRPDHPLTARVMVNRIWQHHFGRGIVATPSNFGLRGAEPSHPELLDWLAARFVESGWSVKEVHRLILASRAYRLSGETDPSNESIDPDATALWRYPRRRLEAEAIRDALLSASGRLDRSAPGPHPFPPIESWGWTQHNPFRDRYPTDRRSVYLMTQRLQKHPFLALFDGPDTNSSTEARSSATVPQQSLYFMNDPFVRDCAEGLANRVRAASPDDPGRLSFAYEVCYGRRPTADEMAASLAFLSEFAAEAGRQQGSEDPPSRAWAALCRAIVSSNEFLYID